MIKKPLDSIQDSNIRQILEHVQEESTGRALELSAVPTATAPLLEDNEVGKYNNKYYRRIGSQIFEVTPSTVIDIT